MLDPLKWFAKLLPEDPNEKAGYGPFTLPDRCVWMQSVFKTHDHYYDIGPSIHMKLSDIDWRIFRALVMAADTVDDPMELCHRAHDICTYWPIMRDFGHYLYGRHFKEENT